MIKGVPIELQTAYNQQPEQYDLLGVMADAADEAGEFEVGEALRWLWRWQRVPLYHSVDKDWYWEGGLQNGRGGQSAIPSYLRHLCPEYRFGDTALRCVERITIGFPKWKAQHSEEYHRLSVPPSTLTPQTTPS